MSLESDITEVADYWTRPAASTLNRISALLTEQQFDETQTFEDRELLCRDVAHDLDQIMIELNDAMTALESHAISCNELHYSDPKRGRV